LQAASLSRSARAAPAAEQAAKYEVVAYVLASSQRLGLTRIGVVGSEQFAE
jgi:hypothetical protein